MTNDAPPRRPTAAELRTALREELLRSPHARQSTGAPAAVVPATGGQADPHEPFPLLDVQQAYWMGRRTDFGLGGRACHGYVEIDIAKLDVPRLERAADILIARHPMLRAVVLADGTQRVLPEVPPYSIATADAGGDKEVLDRIRDEMSHQVLPADRWPLFDIRVTRHGDGRSRLHISFDILIADAQSFEVLAGELLRLYDDPGHELTPIGVTFRDYVAHLEGVRAGEEYQRHLEHWRAAAGALPPAPALSPARREEELLGARFHRLETCLDAERYGRLRARAAEFGVAPAALLLTAFGEVLGAWAAAPRFTLNLTLFDREPIHPDINRVVGPFTNLSLLAMDLQAAPSFADLAKTVQADMWAALEHREVSGVRVLRELSRQRGETWQLPVVFTFVPGGRDARGELSRFGEIVHAVSQTPQVLIDCQVSESGERLWLAWDLVDEAFAPGQAGEMFDAFVTAVTALADDPATVAVRPGHLVPTPPAAIEARIRTERTGELALGPLHELAALPAAADPNTTAVRGSDGTVTHAELLATAREIAARLLERGTARGELVAVAVDRGWRQVAAVLGVMTAGAAYLPVDTTLPVRRAGQLARLGGVRKVVTEPDPPPWAEPFDCLPVAAEPTVAGLHDLPAVSKDDLAYVIFTSGSTGTPKGVTMRHGPVANTVLDVNRQFDVGAGDRVLAVSSIGFDLSVWDIVGTLAAGGSVVCPPPGAAAKDPHRWLELLARERVTVWNSAPPLMTMLVELAELRGATLPDLRLVLLSGDWVPVGLPDRIRAIAPDARVVSLGGATEAAIWSVAYPVDRVDPSLASIPYGFPLTNQRLLVLDWAGRERPIGVEGELYIGGAGLADGYWQAPDLTSAAFGPSAFGRLYRTGDLARRRPDGALIFLGRRDRQVKLNGHRVEIDEIDTVLAQLPRVRAAATSVLDVAGHRTLASYVVPDGGGVTAAEIRDELARRLPSYMVPQRYALVGELPVNHNGKIDWARLTAEAPAEAPKPVDEPAAARTSAAGPVAARITALLEQHLGACAVGPDENLMRAGLDSVDLVRMGGVLERELDFRPPLEAVLADPTVAGLAELFQSDVLDRLGSGQRLRSGSGDAEAAAALVVDPAQRERYRRDLDPGFRIEPSTPRRPLPEWPDGLAVPPPPVAGFAPAAVDAGVLDRLCRVLSATPGERRRGYLAPGDVGAVRVLVAVRSGRVGGLPAGVHALDAEAAELALVDPGRELPIEAFDPFVYRAAARSAAFALLLVGHLPHYEALYGAHGRRFAALEAGAMVQLLSHAAAGVALRPVALVDERRLELDPWVGPRDAVLHVVLGGVAGEPEPPAEYEEGVA